MPSTRGRSAIPELPEVETVRRELEAWLPGRVVLAAELVDARPGPKYASLERAVGGRIASVGRHGKFLRLPLERLASSSDGARPGDELIIHLGMTGVVSSVPPPSHTRVRIEFDGPEPRTLYFRDVRRFGRVLVAVGGDLTGLPTLRRAGPDALSSAFTPAALGRALATCRMAIKTALMSQRPVAGVGNIYADEALWRVAVHPALPSHALAARGIEALHDAIREVLTASLAQRGTTLSDYRTVNGEAGAYRATLDVYGRAGRPCRRCGEPIVRIVVGARGTHHCPRCQVLPRGRAQRPRTRRARRREGSP